VLEGFSQSQVIDVPDAVDMLAQKPDIKQPNAFSAYLQEILQKAKPEADKEDTDSEASEQSDSEDEAFDIIQASKA
jgi:hypothetical protein